MGRAARSTNEGGSSTAFGDALDRLVARWPLVGRDGALGQGTRALRRSLSVVVAGPAGVGKTRFADELRRGAPALGFASVHVVATAATTAVPLGPFAGLLAEPTARDASPGETMHRVRSALRGFAGEQRLLVSVDDAQWLDPLSAAVLLQLQRVGDATVLATLRDDERPPDEVAALWNDSGCVRIDLQNLAEAESAALLRAVFGGPVDQRSARELAAVSDGNPLYLRELLLTAVDAGAVRQTEGRWSVTRFDTSAPRLRVLVEQRIAGLGDADRTLLELVALAEGHGVGFFEPLVDGGSIETLERRSLVQVVVDGRRHAVRLAHPLHGEVVRGSLSVVRSAALHAQLARRLGDVGVRRRRDLLDLARWSLVGGGELDVQRSADAALLAFHGGDDELALRLADAVLAVEEHPGARCVEGLALAVGGRRADAERSFALVPPDPADPVVAVRTTVGRAENLFWGLGDIESARATIEAGMAAVDDPAVKDLLLGTGAAYELMSGRPIEVLNRLEHIVSRGGGRETVIASLIAAPSLVLLGRADEALAVADQGIAVRMEHLDDGDLSELGMLMVARCHALTENGQLAEAEAEAAAGYDLSMAAGSVMGLAWFALKRARALLFQGRLIAADEWFAESTARFAEIGLEGCQRWGAGGRMWCRALRGDAAGVTAAAAAFERLEPRAVLMMDPEVGRARAAVAASGGDDERAAAILVDAAAFARERGMAVLEAGALHDLVRLGSAEVAASRLVELASFVDGPLTAARAAQAVALSDNDGAGLSDAAATFAHLGALLWAAEASAQSADCFRRAGSGRRASRESQIAARLRADCDGARTRALGLLAEQEALTAREREVIGLAAGGATARAIGDLLGISPRTAENHLHRAYVKLGVSSRDELADVLG
jgi:DNA-binding CsgD family transcriptional regulator